MEKYYTTTKVAELCHVSPGSVVRWIRESKLKAAVTAGGHHRVAHEDLVVFMKSLGLEPPSADSGETPVSTADTSQKIRVLIVEDDRQVRQMLRFYFENELPAYEVSEVENGFHAGWIAHKTLPDLIILDLTLPGMDGYQVCQIVRQIPELSQCRILAISGEGDDKKERIMRLGADDFLQKPFSLDALRVKVHNNTLGNSREKTA